MARSQAQSAMASTMARVMGAGRNRATSVVCGALCAGLACRAVGVQPSLTERVTEGECSELAPSTDTTYFIASNQATTEYVSAELFDIVYGSTFKVVVSRFAKEQYVLTQCGQAEPTDAEIEAVAPLEQGYARKHFLVPLQTAGAGSTVHLAFLDYLEVDDRIGLIDSNAVGSCWQKAMSCGSMLESAWGGNATVRAEQIASVDAFFLSCGWDGNCDGVRALQNGVHVPSAQDRSPLKTAEYIKFFGAFFNKEPEATKHFEDVKTAYESVAADLVNTPKPVAAWVMWSDYSQAFEISAAAYKLLMVTDAAGLNFDAEAALNDLPGFRKVSTVSGDTFFVDISAYNFSDSETSVEAARANASSYLMPRLAEVDILIDETYIFDPQSYDFDTFKTNFGLDGTEQYSFLTSARVARYDSSIASTAAKGWDWFESRLARPDLALKGLARVMHGQSSASPTAEFPQKYFRNIAASETVLIISSDTCGLTLPVCSSQEPQPISMIGNISAVHAADAADPSRCLSSAALTAAVALGFAASKELR